LDTCDLGLGEGPKPEILAIRAIQPGRETREYRDRNRAFVETGDLTPISRVSTDSKYFPKIMTNAMQIVENKRALPENVETRPRDG
jgi:hypothetical protein